MDKVKLGIVGLGRLGRNHARNICFGIRNAELTAVCSAVQSELDEVAAEMRPKYLYTDYREMFLNKELDGVVSLLASLAVNAQYLWDNQYDQRLSFSIEHLENFAGSGKSYLGGLGVTDSPASLGTDELKFSRRASYNGQGARIFAGEPVDASCFSTDAAANDSAEAPSWFTTFINKFFHNEEPPMDQKQFDAMNKRMEGLEGQLGEIKTLVEGKFAAAPAAHAAPAAEAEPKLPQSETSPDYAALTTAIAASFKTALDPLHQKLDEMDKRFAAPKPGATVAETTGPADENTPLI